MKRHWFYIMLAVSESPKYGTAIQDDVRGLSRGECRLWPATLYGSLEELAGLGWLEELRPEERSGTIAGRERFYRLTSQGRAALLEEVGRLEEVAGTARARLAAI